MEHIITLNKSEVLNEVAQTTAYTGSKKEQAGDGEVYDIIATTDDDSPQLERFWNETMAAFQDETKRYLNNVRGTDALTITFDVSNSCDKMALETIQDDVFSYFVTSIVGKWFVFTNPTDAAAYAGGAAAILEKLLRKICYKRKPERPVYKIKQESDKTENPNPNEVVS